jgi:Family of unknown function (DUF6491)
MLQAPLCWGPRWCVMYMSLSQAVQLHTRPRLTAITMRLLRRVVSIEVITMKSSIALSLSAAMIIAGCASTLSKLSGPDANLNYAEYAGEPVSSFWMSSVHGWAAVSGTEIFVRSSHDKAYLVTVAGYCPNLQFATTIGFTSAADQVDRFSKVIFGDERCLIQQIRSVDMARLNADRRALRERSSAK